MNLSRTARAVLWGFMGFGLSFIYLPLMLVVINSFNKNKSFNWPPTGFTTMWWTKAASNPGVRDAILLSVLTATFATIIALILGSLAAAAIARYSFFGRDVGINIEIFDFASEVTVQARGVEPGDRRNAGLSC